METNEFRRFVENGGLCYIEKIANFIYAIKSSETKKIIGFFDSKKDAIEFIYENYLELER